MRLNPRLPRAEFKVAISTLRMAPQSPQGQIREIPAQESPWIVKLGLLQSILAFDLLDEKKPVEVQEAVQRQSPQQTKLMVTGELCQLQQTIYFSLKQESKVVETGMRELKLVEELKKTKLASLGTLLIKQQPQPSFTVELLEYDIHVLFASSQY